MKRLILLMAILIPALALLTFSLTRNPRVLPSTLIGRSAPDFELVSLEGKKISLSAASGRPVVLNFWSTWCGPCLSEHQLIRAALHVFSHSDLLFYSILYEDTPENARKFTAEYGEAAPILLDPQLRVAIDYGVSGVPETFLIDREGRVFFKQTGVLTREVLYHHLTSLVWGTNR